MAHQRDNCASKWQGRRAVVLEGDCCAAERPGRRVVIYKVGRYSPGGQKTAMMTKQWGRYAQKGQVGCKMIYKGCGCAPDMQQTFKLLQKFTKRIVVCVGGTKQVNITIIIFTWKILTVLVKGADGCNGRNHPFALTAEAGKRIEIKKNTRNSAP